MKYASASLQRPVPRLHALSQTTTCLAGLTSPSKVWPNKLPVCASAFNFKHSKMNSAMFHSGRRKAAITAVLAHEYYLSHLFACFRVEHS